MQGLVPGQNTASTGEMGDAEKPMAAALALIHAQAAAATGSHGSATKPGLRPRPACVAQQVQGTPRRAGLFQTRESQRGLQRKEPGQLQPPTG